VLEGKNAQFMYKTGSDYHFLNLETYEEIVLPEDLVGEAKDFLVENLEVEILTYEGKPITVNVPPFVELEVVDTPPGIRGDTASGGSKPATLETGLTIQVPLFVNPGDRIRIDGENCLLSQGPAENRRANCSPSAGSQGSGKK